MADDTAGDPMGTRKRWSRKSTHTLQDQCRERGVSIGATTIGKMLEEQDYSLRLNRKSIAETQHPDRNQQFELIRAIRQQFEDRGQPIISVDSKKKELIGNFKNAGRAWVKMITYVLTHDFRSQGLGIGCPFGIYELLTNLGTVIVGTSHDTPQFAVDAISLWLQNFGQNRYPQARELLILCDAGGSNGIRPRLWKYALSQQIANGCGLSIQVCHYPPGTSKWNPVEHRLFSFISDNWQGQPLRSYDIMLNFIAGTKTRTGLRVDALLNEKEYPKGIQISNENMSKINLTRHDVLPAWNYMIRPKLQSA